MDSYERLMEREIERIHAGEEPPIDPIEGPPEGAVVQPHNPTMYRIPAAFPNPPPRAPLVGQQGVRLVLAQCGMSEEQITRFMGNDVMTLEDLVHIDGDAVEEHIKLLARTSGNRGGVIIGLSVSAKVKSLVSFLHELARSGDGIMDAYDVTLPALREWQAEMNVTLKGEDKITVSPPTSFDPKDWVSFKDGMMNYFRQTKGVRGIPLFYVIREDQRPERQLSFMERRMWDAKLSGPEYDNDNARVYQQLVQLLRTEKAWTYVQGADSTNDQNGRQAWKRLCRHYDGPHAVETRIALAAKILDETYYKSEASGTLENYVTTLTNAFRILAQNGAPKSERDKRQLFLNHIQNPNDILLSYMAKIRTDMDIKNDFEKAADSLLEAVSSTQQFHERGATNRKVASTNAKRNSGSSNNSSNKKQKNNSNGKKGNQERRGPPTGKYTLENKDGKKLCNGVDITNPKRTFSQEEWGKLGDYVQILKNTRKVSKVETSASSNGDRFGTGAQEN